MLAKPFVSHNSFNSVSGKPSVCLFPMDKYSGKLIVYQMGLVSLILLLKWHLFMFLVD